MARQTILAAAVAASFLTACGGGGSTGSGSEAESVKALRAYTNLINDGRAFDVTGTDSAGNVIRMVSSSTSQSEEPFPYNGVSGQRLFTEGQVYVDGVLQSGSSSSTSYFGPKLIEMGSVLGDGSCTIDRDGALPPESTEMGTSGGLYNYAYRGGCDSSWPIVSNGRVTWLVQAYDGIGFFCMRDKASFSGLALEFTKCHESAADGTIGKRTRVEIIATTSAGTEDFVATNY